MSDQKFNDDLLMEAKDQSLARTAFPDLFHVLNHQELRSVFARFDAPALAAKRRSRLAGVVAILLAIGSLWAAAAEPLYRGSPVAKPIAILAAVFGIVSIVTAVGGLMTGRLKRQWLYWRLVTERLRQFHFQTFVCRLPELAASLKSEDCKGLYRTEREKWFSGLVLRFDDKLAAEFSQIVSEPGSADIWLHPEPVIPSETLLASLPNEFFMAYRTLRIRHQLQYSLWKLRDETKFFVFGGLRQLENLLSRGALLLIALIFLIHLIIAFSTALGAEEFHSPWVHVAVVFGAVVVLAIRAVEEGVAPKRELERYHRYRLEVGDVLSRFDEAPTLSAKVQAMIDLERISYQEMCDFCRSNEEARFVM